MKWQTIWDCEYEHNGDGMKTGYGRWVTECHSFSIQRFHYWHTNHQTGKKAGWYEAPHFETYAVWDRSQSLGTSSTLKAAKALAVKP